MKFFNWDEFVYLSRIFTKNGKTDEQVLSYVNVLESSVWCTAMNECLMNKWKHKGILPPILLYGRKT